MKDQNFRTPRKKIGDFNFGKETARVFEDMLKRSIPLYDEIQYMIGKIARDCALDGTNVYDLGCSNGITLCTLAKHITKDVTLIGLDYSPEMLKEARLRFRWNKIANPPKLILADLNNPVRITKASVVVLNLTLQFIRPLYRDQLVSSIYKGMVKNGCLIVIEKVLGSNSDFNRMFIQFYHEKKKENKYTDLEIAQKREALENVLIPYRLDENRKLFMRNGFSKFETFFKWFNFSGMIAIK